MYISTTLHLEEDQLGKIYDSRLVKWMQGYIKPYWRLFLCCILFLLISTFLELSMPYIIKIAIDRYIMPQSGTITLFQDKCIQGLTWLSIVYFLALTVNLGLIFGQVYFLQYIGQKAMHDLRRSIFAHLQRLPVAFFDITPVGKLVTRVTNDVEAMNEMFSSVFVYLIKDLFLVIGIFMVMFHMNFRLALFILVMVFVIFGLVYLFRIFVRKAYRQVRQKIASLNTFLQESISGMVIIQMLVREKKNLEEFKTINSELYQANMSQIVVFAIFRPLIEVVGSICVGVIIWYGGGEVIHNTLTLGALVAFLSYIEMFYKPIRDLTEKYNVLQSAMAASERIVSLLNTKIEEQRNGRILPNVRGKIEFQDVWFSYNDEDWVLKGVSFTINPGETVALVGHTGAGKTSIANLFMRFYDIKRGRILLDGVDIRELDLAFLRSQFALVLQDVFIFSGDIRDNIRLKNKYITDEQVIAAAKVAYALPFIQKLPQKLSSELGERGTSLSVGQRQLLSFARALVFDPLILILDEATSSIDTETEELIQKALQNLFQNHTSLVIAHRLSTIRNADRILVLHKGRLVEEGSHKELLQKMGLYRALYKLQFESSARR